MPIEPENLVARAREHLTQEDDAVKFSDERLFALIPSAIAEWIKRTEKDAAKARNFFVETAEIQIDAGAADCVTALENAGIQAQAVEKGDILVEYEGDPILPVQFVSSLSRFILGGIQDRLFLTAYFDGKIMKFRNPADFSLDSLDGTMKIRAVSVPSNLNAIPKSVEGELATILAEIVRKFDTDREHKGTQMNARQLQ